jgi:hypothetical protein
MDYRYISLQRCAAIIVAAKVLQEIVCTNLADICNATKLFSSNPNGKYERCQCHRMT